MKAIFIFLLLSLPFVGFTQFESFSEKNKSGLSFNGQKITKAKFDKIIIADDSIATAIKKTKRYFINSSGDIVYKSKLELSQNFENGLAIIQDKKGNYQLINRAGEVVYGTELGVNSEPKRVLDVVEFGGTGNGIFNKNGIVRISYDSLAIHKDWLIVYKTHKDPYTVKVKDDTKFFGRRKERRYHISTYYDIYNRDATIKHADQVAEMEYFGSHYILKKRDSSYALINAQGKELVGAFDHLQVLSENYIKGKKDSSSILINLQTEKIEIQGDYQKFELKENTILAFSVDTDTLKLIDIFNNGELLNSNLTYLKSLNDQKLVIQDTTGLYITSEKGDKLLGPYTFIGDIKSKHVLVCDSSNYYYINSSTWLESGFYYSLIEAKVHSRKGPPKDFVGSLFYLVFGGWLSDGIDQIEIVDKGHDFYEGWAICATNQSSSNAPFKKRFYISSDEKLRYNFINTKNEKLNEIKYKDCFPMYNGRAWVKEKEYYHVIDSTGNQASDLKYDVVELDRSGYFIVEKNGLKGIVKPDYSEAVPCEHGQLHSRDGKFYNGFGEYEELIYDPEE